MLVKNAIISCSAIKTFNAQFCEVISQFQAEGLDIEVQYAPANHGGELIFTALVLGRKDMDIVKE